MIIDDTHSIHRDYQAVLCPEKRDENVDELERLENLLLDDLLEETPKRRIRNFELQSTYQGEEAHSLVTKHLAKNIRYPVAFVDMRMPPGWDGLQTIEKLHEVDPAIRYAIVTAFSDHSQEEIESRVPRTCSAKVIAKPFAPKEIYETAYRLSCEWHKEQKAEAHTE